MIKDRARARLAAAAAGASPPKRLSDLLIEIGEDPTREWIAVSDLIRLLRDRAFAALVLIFALPNVLPTPPGTSYILGAPLIFLTAQMMFGTAAPWLPRIIRDRALSRENFQAFVGRAARWLGKVERLLRPRLLFLSGWTAERLVGVVCFVLSLILFLPIPLGNMLPALAICLFSLGMLERDGVFVLTGLLMGVLAVGILVLLFYAGINFFEIAWHWVAARV